MLRQRCPYVEHLEDNEETLADDALEMPVEQLKWLSMADLDRLIPPHLSHPWCAQQFFVRASGVTAIVDRLLEHKPEHLPGEVIWRLFSEIFREILPSNPELREKLGIADQAFVVAAR